MAPLGGGGATQGPGFLQQHMAGQADALQQIVKTPTVSELVGQCIDSAITTREVLNNVAVRVEGPESPSETAAQPTNDTITGHLHRLMQVLQDISIQAGKLERGL